MVFRIHVAVCLTLFVMLASSSLSQVILLGGFDDSSGIAKQDSEAAGLLDVSISGAQLRNFVGASNGLWGRLSLEPGAAVSGEPINQKYGDFSLEMTIQNNSIDSVVELNQIHFQSFRDHWKSASSVDITIDGETHSYSLAGVGLWNAFDIDISELMSDVLLEPGTSKLVTLSFVGAQGSRTLMVDNLAISGVSSSTFVVRWGLRSGQTNIVTGSQAISDRITTQYSTSLPASPEIGSNYYPNSSEFSPTFYAAASVSSLGALINNNSNGDSIRLEQDVDPNGHLKAMVVWQDFLNTGGMLDTFSIKMDDSHWTADIVFRWLIQTHSGHWYASSPIADSSSLVTDKAAVLNWYPFTPFSNGEVTISETSSPVDLSDVASVGYYFDAENTDSARRATGLAVSYFAVTSTDQPALEQRGVDSFDTGYTILKVSNAVLNGESVIIAASYEGTVLAMSYDGTVLWTNPLSGLMVRDLWCDDLDGDGYDEVLVAVADGSVRCLDSTTGIERWSFFSPNELDPSIANEVPMNAVCTVRGSTDKYIACGGFDKNLYWLDTNGNLLKTVNSETYSDIRPWGSAAEYHGRAIADAHTPNFLRPVPQGDGTDKLWMLGYIHQQFRGNFYVFDPLGSSGVKPSPYPQAQIQDAIGAFEFSDPDGDGNFALYMGGNAFSIRAESIDISTGSSAYHDESFTVPFKTYRYSTLTDIPTTDGHQLFILCGNKVLLRSADMSTDLGSVLMPHAPHSMWHDRDKGRILFASAQSGGSAIHIVDTTSSYWKQALRDLDPPGKLQAMKLNFSEIRRQVQNFVRPAWERVPDQIIEVSGGSGHPTAVAIREKYGVDNPLFMSFAHTTNVEEQGWKSSVATTTVEPIVAPEDEPALNRFDNGITYGRTRQQLMDEHFQPAIDDSTFGLSFRAGHGNDPYYYNPETLKTVIDASFAKDPSRTTVLSWAEVQSTSDDYKYPLDRLYLNIADHLASRNGIMSFNNKHLFWGSTVHKPVWNDFIAGDLKTVFSTCMEESTSKTGELSLSHRLGLWASGCFDRWGMRTTRDNTSFDRTREIAAQIVPNHFLRHMVYRLAYGARYSHSSYSDADYQSLAWELVASGALYLPRRDEIVSFSPVHFGVTDPDERYIHSNNISKWTTYYDALEQDQNPMFVGRMEACWVGGANTAWDFSSFAAGVLDRRQNFIPPYPHGLVLTTPVENGVFAAPADNRNRLVDNLHPLYRNIMTEFVTDGRDYRASDGSATYAANSRFFMNTVRPAVASGKQQLPVYLTGDEVGWVCAQSAPSHLRLTLIDSGYLNPQDRNVTIHFNTVSPLSVTDILSGENIAVNGTVATVTVPLGMFRFLDIELSEPYFPKNDWGAFASEHGLNGSSFADEDRDGVQDLLEFAFNGDPLDSAVQGELPRFFYDASAGRVHFDTSQRSSETSGIVYNVEWTDDLVHGTWHTDWSLINSSLGDSGFEDYEHILDVKDLDLAKAFFRVKVDVLLESEDL